MTNYLKNRMKFTKSKQAIHAIAVFIISIFSNTYILEIKKH